LIKNSQPFVKKCLKTASPWGGFFESHCTGNLMGQATKLVVIKH